MKDEKNSHPYFNRSFISYCKNVLYWLSIIVVAFIVYQNYLSEDEEKVFNYDFRNTKWGMSVDTVKAIEKNEFVKENLEEDRRQKLQYLSYKNDFKVYVDYIFSNNKLWGGSYSFETDHNDLDQYINQYNRIKEEISAKYGKPYKSKDKLHKETERPYKQSGFSVLLSSEWGTHSTKIYLKLDVLADYYYFIRVSYTKAKYDFEENDFF